jgi:hypothetical protein
MLERSAGGANRLGGQYVAVPTPRCFNEHCFRLRQLREPTAFSVPFCWARRGSCEPHRGRSR